MANRSIQRRSKRINYQTKITLEDKRTGFRYSGTLQNYSQSGLYFESHYAQRPGRKIRIESENLPFGSTNNAQRAKVIWRKLLDKRHSTHLFGVGARFC
ncbi:MAG: PilZ domain-containing protein [Desulfobacterales bacterium]|nr:PilZ domain-containing protein [Desulfobacterales bacterium]